MSNDPGVRERFLETALELFAHQGVSATSMAQIAAKIKVTPAMGNYYFSNREKLLDAVVAEKILPQIDYVWNEFSTLSSKTIFSNAIENLVAKLIGLAAKRPWLPALWVSEVLSQNGQFRSRVLPYVLNSYSKNFEQAFNRAKKLEEINTALNPRLFMLSVLGSTLLPMSVPEFSQVNPSNANDREAILKHALAVLLPSLVHSNGQASK